MATLRTRLLPVLAVLALAACSGGVGIAGTVPPAPGTLPPDPTGLTATTPPPDESNLAPTDGTPVPSSPTPGPTLADTPGGATPTPTGTIGATATPRPTSPPRTPIPTDTPRPTATPVPPPTASESPPPTDTIVVTVYLLLDSGDGPRLVPVPRRIERVPAIGGASLASLLAGAEPAERRAGINSAIPPSVSLLGLTIQDGIATVDLSTEFGGAGATSGLTARVAQVVYTLTQFPTVDRVAFRIDGAPVLVPAGDGSTPDRPLTRDDSVALLPPVFVDAPRWGESVAAPLRIAGRANVFEATFRAELRDAAGNVLATRSITASCGSGCWGDFAATLAYHVDKPQTGELLVQLISERDGSVGSERVYPLVLGQSAQ